MVPEKGRKMVVVFKRSRRLMFKCAPEIDQLNSSLAVLWFCPDFLLAYTLCHTVAKTLISSSVGNVWLNIDQFS